jgi:hypothetical protein
MKKHEEIDLDDDELDDLDAVWERKWSAGEPLAAHIAEEFLPKSLSADWVPYRGPLDGSGWKNTATGDVRYQDDMPSSADQKRFEFDDEREKKQGRRFEDYKAVREYEPSDDLRSDLDEFEYNHYATPEFIRAVFAYYDVEPVEWGEYDMKGVYVSDDLVVEWDGEDNTFSISDVEEFVYNADVDIQLEEYEENLHDEFWNYPGPVYHATPSENVASIEADGIGAASETRGMSNRHVGDAVFTTAEWEEALLGTYGDAIFEIDTVAMRKDGYRPRIEEEPEVSENNVRGSLAYALGVQDWAAEHESVSGGMSPNTLVFHGSIPAKYVKRVQ